MQSSLRPLDFDEFVGQAKTVETLKVIIASAAQRQKHLDHILFYGPPGLGKTSLASIVANEMGVKIRYAQGPLLEKKADILSLFGSISEHELIFIDEIHGISKNVEELLYSALEEGTMDLIIGVEGNTKIVRMKLPDFTLIGATTQIGRLSLPLKDRFGIVFKLLPYNLKELETIVHNSAKTLKIKIDRDAVLMIAEYARNTPRVANNLLRRVVDFKVVKNLDKIDKPLVEETFRKIGLYKHGLSEHHIAFLKVLFENFSGQWTSVDMLAGLMQESKMTLEQEIEPVLVNLGFVAKSMRGRKISMLGIDYLTEIRKENRIAK